MNVNNIFESKLFRAVILGIAGLIILVFVFGLGIYVETKRADFSFEWAEAYHQNFAGPQNGVFGNMLGEEFTDANGVFGQIIGINDGGLIIKDRNNVEKVVLISDKTTIVYQRTNLRLSDLRIYDIVVVIGDPINRGQIQAEFIRVLPQLPQNSCQPNQAQSQMQDYPPARCYYLKSC